MLAPPRIVASGETSEIGDETPAVASLLTNGFVVTPHAAVATLLDLVARGWLRIEQVDDEVVVLVDGHGTLDDLLTPYEQQVLNHVHKLAAGTTSGVTGAGIEVAGLRLPRRWSRRFNAAVIAPRPQGRPLPSPLAARRPGRAGGAARARRMAVVAIGARTDRTPRSPTPCSPAPSGSRSRSRSSSSPGRSSRSLARRPSARPTVGRQRAEFWMSLRAWMEPRGFEHASSTAARNASRAVGYAAAFGLAERAVDEVPVLPEDDRTAWSNAVRPLARRAGALPVPARATAGIPRSSWCSGSSSAPASCCCNGCCSTSPRGTRSPGSIDDFEDQADIIHDVAVGIAAALMVPLLWMAWLVVAGAFDLFATIERRGLVVRARRPQRVVPYRWLLGPLARRDRYALFVAIDDGRSDRVGSWLANERTAVPQGARAHVRATPILGYVRSSEPIGTR